METTKINATSSIQTPAPASKKEETKATTPEMKKDGNKKLKLVLTGLAITGAAITAGVMMYKGHSKKAAEAVENAAETVKKLSGNFDERFVKIRQEYSLDDLKAKSKEIIEAFKELKEETISSLDDIFIRSLVEDVYPDNKAMMLKSVLEEDFTPDELSKIMKKDNYKAFLYKYIIDKALGTPDPKDTNAILNYLHGICKNS